MSVKTAELEKSIDAILKKFESVPTVGLGAYLRIEAGLIALVALGDSCRNPDEDPYPSLLSAFDDIARLPVAFATSIGHIRKDVEAAAASADGLERTADLFEAAWTQYDDKTYDHSVGLVERRLAFSGFDREFFSGKTCFDGGCGTGRLSIAMAKAGAKQVVAVDISRESLGYLKKACSRYGLNNIEIVEQDVTNLRRFASNSFDFVASNGVLHHTEATDQGIVEHFRITRIGGIFWLYLYGANGFYWNAYDKLKALVRDIEPRIIRAALDQMKIRQGLIYTYLDNLLAPRVYLSLIQVLNLLRPFGEFEYVHAKGSSPIDDTKMLLATRWGREIFGPDGEIRIVVTKK
jgi:ubiquinone/menaquinone biosynthesis C-methylase UbiE